jgi:hypothetical protein
MRSETRAGAPFLLLTRGVVFLLGAALTAAACGDDAASKKPGGNQGGAGGDATAAAAGEPAAGGSDVMTGGGTTGEAGSDAMGGLGTMAGQPGAAGSGSEGMSVDEFCELQARAREWLRECRPFFGDASGWWGAQNIDQFCGSGRDAIDAGRLTYDPVQAATCAALSVGGCEDIEAFAFGAGAAQAGFLQTNDCAGVVIGTVALGDPCHADSTKYTSECAEGFCSRDACPGVCTAFSAVNGPCDGVSTACDPAEAVCDQGVCVALDPVLGVGDDCSAAPDACVTGAICHQGECALEVPLGAMCNSDAQCPDSAYCSTTCQQRVAVNGDCTNGAQCVAGALCNGTTCDALGQDGDACPCDTGFWCGTDEQCHDLLAEGESCAAINSVCEPQLVCVPSGVGASGPTGMECQPRGGAGDFCNPQYPGTCQAPFFCDPSTFTCLAPSAENGPCNLVVPLDSCQEGLYCYCGADCAPAHQAVATCESRLADNDDCSRHEACLSGSCIDSVCAPKTTCP